MNQADKTRQALILGALLHDIGKFVQRAQDNPRSQDHCHWGEEWFQDNLSEKLTGIFSEDNKETIRSAIANHHTYERYISLADAISAGMDRIEIELKDEEEKDPFTKRLVSIFSRISISNKDKKCKYHKLTFLGKNNLLDTFPIDNDKCSYQEYRKLLTAFNEEINKLDFSKLSPPQLVDWMYFLLLKYTWCIPSAAYRHEPDVSLFDHLKTTAAIAICLYDYHKEHSDENLNIETKAFQLIGGDVSGIQDYIFSILPQHGKVAKRLRARSLYVQLISEIATHKILHSFALPLCNQIISAGGNFYVLVPSLRDANRKIQTVQGECEKWMFEKLNAELSLPQASMELSGKDLAYFSKVLEKLRNNLAYQKYQSHRSVVFSGTMWNEKKFLRSEVIEGDAKVCQSCGKHPQTEDSEEGLCEHCSTDTKMGSLLPKRKYIAFFNDPTHEFRILDYSFELWGDKDLKNITEKNLYLVLNLNDSEINHLVRGFKYITTHIPAKEHIPSANVEEKSQIVTFEDIANVSEGDKLLGYVKADIDNLGLILRYGLEPEEPKDKYKIEGIRPSISRFVALSRMLETFFSGYLQFELIGNMDFKGIYTVFSGGDDLFIIGPWDKTINFIQEIRKDFSKFCANNPDFTFSAGISLAKHHIPVSFCAKSVHNALKEAKNRQDKDITIKDGVALFGQTLSWNELETILIETRKITEWLEHNVISRSLVYNFRQYGEMYQKYNKKRKVEYLKFIPLLTHDINRNLSLEKQKDAFLWAEALRHLEGSKNLPYLKTIMEYVLTYTRG